jgi:hypothetical protein
MSTLKRLMTVWILALGLSVFATDYQWPGRHSDTYPYPEGKDAQKIIEDRFAKASKKALGGDADIAAIKKLVLSRITQSQPSVNEIRWLSSTLVMVDASWYEGPLGAAGYYYVVEKKKDKWEIVTYYMLWIS